MWRNGLTHEPPAETCKYPAEQFSKRYYPQISIPSTWAYRREDAPYYMLWAYQMAMVELVTAMLQNQRSIRKRDYEFLFFVLERSTARTNARSEFRLPSKYREFNEANHRNPFLTRFDVERCRAEFDGVRLKHKKGKPGVLLMPLLERCYYASVSVRDQLASQTATFIQALADMKATPLPSSHVRIQPANTSITMPTIPPTVTDIDSGRRLYHKNQPNVDKDAVTALSLLIQSNATTSPYYKRLMNEAVDASIAAAAAAAAASTPSPDANEELDFIIDMNVLRASTDGGIQKEKTKMWIVMLLPGISHARILECFGIGSQGMPPHQTRERQILTTQNVHRSTHSNTAG